MPPVRGGKIKRAYEDMGFTRADFANLVEIPPRTLTNITVNGATCSRAVAARIARGLGWDVEQVLAETDVEQALAEAATRPKDTRPATAPKQPASPVKEQQPKRGPKNQVAAA